MNESDSSVKGARRSPVAGEPASQDAHAGKRVEAASRRSRRTGVPAARGSAALVASAVPVAVPVVAPVVATGATSPDVNAPAAESGVATADTAWRAWLAGGSARDVLARIVRDDPLGLQRRVAEVVRAQGYLLDADRVLLRCFALVARHAARYRGEPALDAWLDARAREAVESIVREDSELERRPPAAGENDGAGCGAAFLALARPLGLEPAALLRACARFNRLPDDDRIAFCAFVLRGRAMEELVAERGEPAAEIARRARRGLDALVAVEPARTEPQAPNARRAEVET